MRDDLPLMEVCHFRAPIGFTALVHDAAAREGKPPADWLRDTIIACARAAAQANHPPHPDPGDAALTGGIK